MDGGLGTVKELRRRLENKNLLTERNKKGEIEVINSYGKNEFIDLSNKLLNM